MRIRTLLLLCAALCCCRPTLAQRYPLGPDSMPQPGVPKGEVTHYAWKTSKIYPGTVHDYSVYIPSQYDASKPACLMIFQDGGGGMNVPTVFDNLIAKKEMPVTVAILISPGVVPAANPNALPRYNRSREYDNVSDDYVRFLIEEIVPEVAKKVNLSTNPNDRGLAGASSGGIAAFTGAWLRPDQFRRVISYIGSFTDLQGGNTFPSQIRKYEPRPIRVFMEDGSHDQDIYSGAWYIANQDVYAALKFAGYDAQFVVGEGGHSGEQGASILPDALRWLWRDYPAPITTPKTTNQPIMKIAQAGEDWQLVSEGHKAIGGLAADGAGNVYLTDVGNDRIYKIDGEGRAAIFRENVAAPEGLAVGPDGRLIVCQPSRRRILAIDTAGKETVLVANVVADCCVVAHDGTLYFGSKLDGKIWRVDRSGHRAIADAEGVPALSGLALSPDQTLLFASHLSADKYVYSYQRTADGGLAYKQTYFDLLLPYGSPHSYGAGMATDTLGWLYVASLAGVQVMDQAGRVNGILANPEMRATGAVTFGGSGLDTLYVSSGGKVYRRKTQAKGVLPFQDAIKPPGPHL